MFSISMHGGTTSGARKAGLHRSSSWFDVVTRSGGPSSAARDGRTPATCTSKSIGSVIAGLHKKKQQKKKKKNTKKKKKKNQNKQFCEKSNSPSKYGLG